MEHALSENATLAGRLQHAFQEESSTHLQFLEFAQKAGDEGWLGVSALFRAVARAEQVHAANHAHTLRQMGCEAVCVVRPLDVRSTVQNLRSALAHKRFEADTYYPELLHAARDFRDVAAIRTFMWALDAEKSHACLFQEALDLIEAGQAQSWAKVPRRFRVCPTCGLIRHEEQGDEMCRVCHTPGLRFEYIG